MKRASLWIPAVLLWSGSTVPVVQAPAPGNFLLAEVLFDPKAGDTSFVELVNVGARAVDLTAFVLRVDTVDLPLPRLAQPFAPGTRVLIRFDGRGTTEGRVVHAPALVGLRPEGGTVSLRWNDDRVADRIAWGDAPDAFVPTVGGLAMRQVERGSSFGRPPGAKRPGARSDWVVYEPGQVTPGEANPLPPVAQLLPIDGAILDGTSAELSWYPVPGAARYRVQLAGDTVFAQPRVNQVVTEPQVNTGPLPAGVYWWRVQAMPADGPPAPWSRPQRIELGPTGSGGGDGGESKGGGDQRGPAASSDAGVLGLRMSAPVTLNVPLIMQHKDSKMLHLEVPQEGRLRTAGILPRSPHAWDRDHGTLDRQDPADNMNCTLASLAMMNRYYGGDLTQDRIGYEAWSRRVTQYRSTILQPAVAPLVARLWARNPQALQEAQPGPERDLHLGQGMPWERLMAAGIFALGGLPSPASGGIAPFGSLTRDDIWNTVVAEIGAGRPVLGHNSGHAMVIRGYELRGTRRLLYVNDPWHGRYAVDVDAAAPPPMGRPIMAIWTYPRPSSARRQEPEVSGDADGDGVVDFDETERFRTDPAKRDSDDDGVPDKQDIESGIYEAEFGLGYAYNPGPNSPGRDYDFDGVPTELDPDSDNGGCKDGEEDLNADSERAGAETGNFYPADDMCGTLQGSVSYAIDAVNSDPNQLITELHDQAVILVKLVPESPGSPTYIDAGSTYSYQGHARIEVIVGPGCIMWGREMSRGGGTFTTSGAEIGATRGDDGTLALGAQAGVRAQIAAGGCGGGGTSLGERSMNFPDCVGRLSQSRAGPQQGLTYSFNCTIAPNLGPGWTVTRFIARGFVRVR